MGLFALLTTRRSPLWPTFLTGSRARSYPRCVEASDAIRWHVLTDAERTALEDAARRLFPARPWIRAAWLYGSAGRGQPARDIDIGLLARPLPSRWGEEFTVANELADATRIRDVPFDVRTVNLGDPVFLNNLLRDGKLLYCAAEDERIEFEALAMAKWLDFKPVWEQARAAAFERWRGE